jgi:hypothetical protein
VVFSYRKNTQIWCGNERGVSVKNGSFFTTKIGGLINRKYQIVIPTAIGIASAESGNPLSIMGFGFPFSRE